MKRKSAASFLILSFVCLFLVGATFSTCEAQWWWLSSSSSSSGGTTTGCPSGAICRPETPGSYGTSGPYGYTTTSLPGYAAGATVYVPKTATAPFSAIVFMQPFWGTQANDAAWGPFFATHGIVYVNCSANSTTTDTVDMRATQQWNAYNALKAMNTRTGSVLKGKLATSRIGLMGWSMGGGATWINASKSGPKTAVTLAGHNMSAVNFASKGYSIKCPTLLMNGSTDMTVLGGMGQSLGVYTAIPYGVPKAIYEITLAGHFDWSGPVTALTPNSGKIALAFQKTYLDGDTRWKTYIRRPLDALVWRTSSI